jgi:hypothetical protein
MVCAKARKRECGAIPVLFRFMMFWYGEDLRVAAAAADLRRILGTRLVMINGMPIQEVGERLERLIPQGESQWYRLDACASTMSQVEPLVALRIVHRDGSGVWTFLHDNGQEENVRITASSRPLSSAFTTAPSHQQNSDQSLWVTMLPDQATGP